ncbi:MAG: hypothetical protein LIP77_02250 [Planctomycetes bacterium]|nr:hypothetical protein [Planctomycetota bacterium]
MGTAGVLLGGTLLGVGTAAMSKKSFSLPSEVISTMAPSLPETPAAPAAVESASGASTTENALMEAERERERQLALWRRQQSQEVFTSGLGASGTADTAKKSLLGG